MTSTKCSRPSSPVPKLMQSTSSSNRHLFCASLPLPNTAKWHFHPTSKIASAKYRIKLLQKRLDSIVSLLCELKSSPSAFQPPFSIENNLTSSPSFRDPSSQRKAQIHHEILRLHRLKSKLFIQLQKYSKSSKK